MEVVIQRHRQPAPRRPACARRGRRRGHTGAARGRDNARSHGGAHDQDGLGSYPWQKRQPEKPRAAEAPNPRVG